MRAPGGAAGLKDDATRREDFAARRENAAALGDAALHDALRAHPDVVHATLVADPVHPGGRLALLVPSAAIAFGYPAAFETALLAHVERSAPGCSTGLRIRPVASPPRR